jgi:hypothetical protein
MEGIIILIIIFSIIQNIVEKIKKTRQSKMPDTNNIPRQDRSNTNENIDDYNQDSYDQLDPFKNWQDIFFPKQPQQKHDTYKLKDIGTIHTNKVQISDKVTTHSISHFDNSNQDNSILESSSKNDNSKLKIDTNSLRQGILLTEILGPPKSTIHWSKNRKSSQ